MELPRPMTAEEQIMLRAELREASRAEERNARQLEYLTAKLAGVEEQRRRVADRLESMTKFASTAASLPTPSDSQPDATSSIAAESTIPRWKRSRAAESQVVASDGATAAAPGQSLRRVERGAVFGFLKGTLAGAMKQNEAADVVAKKQLAAQNEVERRHSEVELSDLDRQLVDLRASIDGVRQAIAQAPPSDALAATVAKMHEAETAYCEAHFLKADGAHYDISFVPVAHTPHSRALLDDQLLAAATQYMDWFRRDADVQVKRVMAARGERMRNGQQRGGGAQALPGSVSQA